MNLWLGNDLLLNQQHIPWTKTYVIYCGIALAIHYDIDSEKNIEAMESVHGYTLWCGKVWYSDMRELEFFVQLLTFHKTSPLHNNMCKIDLKLNEHIRQICDQTLYFIHMVFHFVRMIIFNYKWISSRARHINYSLHTSAPIEMPIT